MRSLLEVIRLNLTMVVCSALLILGVRITQIGFPYVAPQGSVINIFTLTIPSLLLTVLPVAAPVSRTSYSRIIARFVIPAGVCLSIAAFTVYMFFVQSTGISYAQLAVTYTLVYGGIVVGFLTRRGRLTALLGLTTATVVTLLLPSIPLASQLFRLTWLAQPLDYAIIWLAVAAWLAVVLVIWRFFPPEQPLSTGASPPVP